MLRQAVAASLAALAIAGCSSLGIEATMLAGTPVASQGLDPEQSYTAGKALFASGDLGLALAHFRQANLQSPGDVRILNGMAAVYDRMHRFDLAQKYYRQALAIDPEGLQTLNNLGYSYILAGDLPAALQVLRKAYATGRDSPVFPAIEANVQILASRTATASAQAELRRTEATQATPASPVSAIRRVGDNQYDLRTGAGAPFPEAGEGRGNMPAVPAVPVAAVSPAPLGNSLPGEARGPSAVGWGPRDTPKAAVAVEVSNGAGRSLLASRVSTYLGQEGLRVIRRTNDPRFDHRVSTIFYRKGQAEAARRLGALLPFQTVLKEANGLAADVKVRLGSNALAFDLVLMERFGSGRRAAI